MIKGLGLYVRQLNVDLVTISDYVFDDAACRHLEICVFMTEWLSIVVVKSVGSSKCRIRINSLPAADRQRYDHQARWMFSPDTSLGSELIAGYMASFGHRYTRKRTKVLGSGEQAVVTCWPVG